jgi:hypothetical protein
LASNLLAGQVPLTWVEVGGLSNAPPYRGGILTLMLIRRCAVP